MKFDDIKKLHQKKYRAEFGRFLVEGEHLVLELQKAAPLNPLLQGSELYVTNAYEQWQSPFKTHLISDRQMAQIADTKTPQGIVALVPMPDAPVSAPVAGERAIYLHEIQDPGNLGTILRTLAWFGNFRCLLSPGSVDPYNPKVVRSSMGAIFHAPMELDVALDSLRTRFARIACLDMQGEPVQSTAFTTFECYLFGNEARGVPRDQLNALGARPFTIPGCGAIESLNLAATVNMCAYELSR
ncbi:TrmH family RNA methyltransferase [Stutzerimonas stutzeri]|uniref:rRNA methylase n=1 Tax=Stutzerimonas stutzeri (strain ATCC 17588 / DSM 5190 / CCUG 11256 / JCM 5965 / LMG 11199 / NBRC 14165 / NCIMB 11358 / Stanier 221) TaxID=96563 RepID=F8H8A5_STUS2|nr:RNA methyltransferase [Stutzerimonas stutzeri]MPS57033.1 RNA methyltransferase [Pseudomonas sp.]AEJ06274.1 rRNA methylase [Stutzerimonas stutzeri]AVX14071.1 RNA methyltransferase [Stutzerimonas stutzeri]AWK98546.1 RNA methyltransferase [Stutzerimonas stutzeri]MDH0497968.1 RNA methyltransferase [Stutzerimonas stutzeri]